MCNANLVSTQSLGEGSVFNARIFRTVHTDGLGWYASVRIGGAFMQFHYTITYVLANPQTVVDLTNKGKCRPQNFCPFRVRHWDSGNTVIFNCVPADKRHDRWLYGEYPGGAHWPPDPGD